MYVCSVDSWYIYFFLLLFIRKKYLKSIVLGDIQVSCFHLCCASSQATCPILTRSFLCNLWATMEFSHSFPGQLQKLLDSLCIANFIHNHTHVCVCLTFLPAVSPMLWGVLGWVSAAKKWEGVNDLGVNFIPHGATFNPYRMEIVDTCPCLVFSRVWDKVLGVDG